MRDGHGEVAASFFEGLGGLDEKTEVDSSERGTKLLLRSRHGGYLRVSPSAWQLLRWVRDGRSFEELEGELRRVHSESVSAETLRAAYLDLEREIEAIDRRAAADVLAWSFWLRRPFLKAPVVAAMARRLAVLFHPFLAASLVVVAALLVAGLPEAASAPASGAALLLAYTLFVASLVVHELGHASACARFGAPPGEIGFLMYLVYPAFYSDVTSAWTLGRFERVVVDLGGNYFQLVAGAVYASVFLLTGIEAFRLAVFLILAGVAFSLNPFFRFDGYWILADALGVVDLGRQPWRLLRRALHLRRGSAPEPLPWPCWVVVVLALYTVASVGFWLWILSHLVPFLWRLVTGFSGS